MMNKWLAFWCCEGFECIIDISSYENWDQQQLIEILCDRPQRENPLNHLISNMKMRARFNPDRQYELYVFKSSVDVEKSQLDHWADHDPQSLADWIRSNGVKLYSDHHRSTAKRIT
jgi:hypothetical protein